MTGACEWSESSEVISGMLAPPPMVTTAATFVQLILLRSNAFSSAVNTPSSVGAIRLSSSVRVTRIPEWYPGSSAISSVTVSVESRSLASRHSSRSLVSDPTAAVPAGSSPPALATTSRTWFSSAWSIRSPENSEYRVVSSIGSNDDAASANVMLVPPPPKSSSATTPCGLSPELACSAVSEATASDTSRAGIPLGARLGLARIAVRSAHSVDVPQCAGTAIAVCGDGRPVE